MIEDANDVDPMETLEWRIRTINRWNAMATVVSRNKVSSEYGGISPRTPPRLSCTTSG